METLLDSIIGEMPTVLHSMSSSGIALGGGEGERREERKRERG